jgi:excisionase family DNA binding protein
MPISFSVRVAAEQCGLSERTIHAAIKQGDLKVMRVGRRVLITPAALENYLNGRTGKGKAVSGD